MEVMYRQAKCGWSDEEKWQEMFEDDTNRFLIVFEELTNTPVGFIMFQFCYEEDIKEELVAVVYCMEIQIEKDWRGKRIGQFLMQQLESVGKQWLMVKSMLTVFIGNSKKQWIFICGTCRCTHTHTCLANQPAYRFYIQLG
ncbi:hypothetical protein K7432_010350 [Basidiobolus ranarum]|uniref:N-alpha-acetyltransferase 40 n=1 Tax=Basidiobolus ranarum TaxID=34480 RepID=A0ABR2WNV1_9FUNG